MGLVLDALTPLLFQKSKLTETCPVEFHCSDFETFHLEILFNTLLNLINNRCYSVAGLLWWSCTVTGMITTRFFSENQGAPLDWDISCVAWDS